jgi:hypothetical protein
VTEKHYTISQFFNKKTSFNTEDILKYFLLIEKNINRNTLNWRIHKLVEKDIIKRIGRGKFMIGNKKELYIDPTNRIIRLNNFIKRNYPYAEYCIWEMDYVKPFCHHYPFVKFTLVEVEKVASESVFHNLQDNYKNVFYLPDIKFLQMYANTLENLIIVKNLVSEAPLQSIKGVPTVSIEKLLVDIMFENEFYFLRGREMRRIYENVFYGVTINQSKLLRYSTRKGKREDMTKFLRDNNLFIN